MYVQCIHPIDAIVDLEEEVDINKSSLSNLNTFILLPLFATPYKARKQCRYDKDLCPDKYTTLIS